MALEASDGNAVSAVPSLLTDSDGDTVIDSSPPSVGWGEGVGSRVAAGGSGASRATVASTTLKARFAESPTKWTRPGCGASVLARMRAPSSNRSQRLHGPVRTNMAAAVDTTAGERERNSLEPLLTTSVKPLELAAGKLASVVVLNACTVTLTLSGFYLILRFAPLPAVGIPFLFGLSELGKFFVALSPLITLMPAVFLYLGARARSFKEAQSNVALLFLVVSLIPIVQMFSQKKEPVWLNWIPISGQYGLLSRALRGEDLPIHEVLQSYAIPSLLTLAALLGVARLFARESALAGNP